MNVLRPRLLVLLAPFVLAACPETDPDSFPGPAAPCADLSTPEGYIDVLSCSDAQSCELQCTCSEPAKPYQCPAMEPWSAMTHATCGGFDGSTVPDIVQGTCTATTPTADALQNIGLDSNIAGRWHLPDGHFIQPAGHDQVIHGADVASSFLVDEMLIPGTSFAVLVDAGVEDNALYAVDLDALAQDAPALVSEVKISAPDEIDHGLAFVAPNEIVAAGAGAGKLYAFTIDLTSGALARNAANDVDLAGFYAGGIATTADPNVLVVTPQTASSEARVVDLAAKTWTTIDLSPSHEMFGVFADPNDVAQNTFWISEYDTQKLVRFDIAQHAITATYPTGKNPEGVVITPSHVLVANSDDDSISVFDSNGKNVQTLSIRSDGLPGVSPSVLAYDPNLSRVYATLANINAIDVYAYNALSTTTPLAPLGRIPTSWWPTALTLRADGSLVVATAKGHGTGPSTGTSEPADLTKGSVAVIAPPSLSDLDATSTTVVASRHTSAANGFPTVTCPSSKTYDFPVPVENTNGPSASIQNIVWIVRESKSFDGVFGDLPGVNGDAQNVLSPGNMDTLFANARALAKRFSNFDDYGSPSEGSLQGHVWTAYGRSTDFIERAWSSTEGRAVRHDLPGIDPIVGAPGEGSLFIWGDRNAIAYQDMGEIVGIGAASVDPEFPGLLSSLTVPDTEKACYIAARARALCNLDSLTYVVLPNDATWGMASGLPTVNTMIAVNDVATGMIADAISHSPFWPTTLVIVTEDDAATGEDHVDAHRTPLFMISPWVQHGYVSHTKISTSSIHKLVANILGKPYQSEDVEDAAIPFDAFTSTPDYTPYTFSPLQTDVSCN
jgi:DNA-binding beta-propeller fold protein YncE